VSADYQLGCGTYTVMVQPRCGGSFTCQLPIATLAYNRILNNISQAQITVPLRGACCECLAAVNPWQHELNVFRNGESVWVGPIIDLEFDMANQVATIFARDLLTWADHRLVELADVDYDPTDTDLADAYTWLLTQAYCKDPWCMSYGINPVGIPVERFFPAFDKIGGETRGGRYPVIGDQLRELADAGVDYTVVGRHLWGGSTNVVNPILSNVILLDKHFRSAPTVKVAGSKMGNRVVAAGGQGGFGGWAEDQLAVEPVTPGPMTPALLNGIQLQYGLLETFVSSDVYDDVDTTITPNAVGQMGKSRYDLLYLPYAYIKGGDLTPETPMNFSQTLIPGGIIRIHIENTCRDLAQETMRLTEIRVRADENDEIVSIELTPLGSQGIT